MDYTLHTVQITGHLIFDSRHRHFRSAFKEFIESEGLQLQITDMVNADLPSMEIGVKLSISNDFHNLTGTRYADSALKVSAPNTASRVVKKPVEKPAIRPVNPETGSDLAFY